MSSALFSTQISKDRSLLKVVFLVCFIHLFFTWYFFSIPTHPPIVRSHQKVVVRTVQLQPVAASTFTEIPTAPEKVISTPTPVAKPRPKPVESIPQKKPIPVKVAKPLTPAPKKPAPVKKTEAKAKPTPKVEKVPELSAEQEALRLKQQELLTKAKEKIAQASASGRQLTADKRLDIKGASVPQALTSLQIDALPVRTTHSVLSLGEVSYRDELATRLKMQLRLPDYGQVQVKLTLNQAGKVITVAIVQSASAKNSQYIEKTLPTLVFPPFGQELTQASQYTFSLTLNNEEA